MVFGPRQQRLPVRSRRAAWRTACGALAALCLLVLASGSARAELRLCNQTNSRVGIAIGYKDKTGWVTEGWWNVLSHACEVLFQGEIASRFYYVYAVDYDRGGEWKGKDRMCIADKSFTIRGVEGCQERGFRQARFYEVDTGDATNYTIRLVDSKKTQ